MSVDSPSATGMKRPVGSGPGEAPVASSVVSLGDQLRHRPIVVAVTGDADGAAPVRVASALEQRFGTAVSAVQVLDVSDLPNPLPTAFTFARELIGDAPYAEDARRRRQQFSDWLGRPNEWSVHIAVGSAPYQILGYAERQDAALIVMGLRHHGVVDRVLRDEATLTVARRAHGAVLAVVPGLRGLPRRSIVGVDFGPASIRAARAALDVLARPTPADVPVLRLVYVDKSGVDEAHEDTAGEALIKHLGVDAAFERLVRELCVPPAVRVECVTRHGPVATELLACAEESRADLIAIGSLRHERLERWLLGSVTTEIVRDGRCSVLVIPPPRAAKHDR